MAKKEQLVRYLSPFGTPAWMPRARAESLVEEEDRRYVKLQQAGILHFFTLSVEASKCDGPPRFEVY
jgi:hypothetical protein